MSSLCTKLRALSNTTSRGLVGPTRQFGVGTLYHPQVYALIVGALLPFPFWLWQRRYPTSWIKFVSTPVILNGVSAVPPAVGINYSAFFAVGFVFQYLIRKRNFAWWSKFNYITSAAMDSGTVLSVILIFFTLEVRLFIYFSCCIIDEASLLAPQGRVHVELVGEQRIPSKYVLLSCAVPVD